MNGFNSYRGGGNRGGYNNPTGSILNGITNFFRSKSVLSKIIAVNIVIWIIVSFISVFGWLFKMNSDEISYSIITWFAIPADFSALLDRPWTLISYMFLHFDFFHILFNMLWLYWFGTIFLQYFSRNQLLSTYFWGGIFGALLFVISYNSFPVFAENVAGSHALGASAAIMAITAAIAVYVPNYRINLLIFGPVKIWIFALVYFVMDLFMIPIGNSGGHISHIGGALWGVLFALSVRSGNDIFTINFEKWMSLFKSKPRFKTTVNKKRPATDEEFNRQRKANEDEIDHILDKISKYGYSSLTAEEKELLFRKSKK